MLTIKVFLTESGRIADLRKDFPLYQGQFQNKLLDVYVPTSILAPELNVIGYYVKTSDPTNTELDSFVLTKTGKSAVQGDIVFFINNSSTTYTYKKCTRGASTWTLTSVDYISFLKPFGTNVKIATLSKTLNGVIVQSTARSMRFVKNQFINGIEYALFERKLPKEFTTYYGVGSQAPEMVINVVNVDVEESAIESLITSQTCTLEVLPSAIVDNDATIESSELEELEAIVGTHTGQIALLEAEVEPLVEQVATNTQNIANNTTNIASNSQRISALENGETYIGKMTVQHANFPPSKATLDAFVEDETSPSRQARIGDVIIVVESISGATDKIYKFIRNTTDWDYYELPAIEKADNGSYGIVEGTKNVASASSNNVIVDIYNGDIKDIEVSGKTIKTNLDLVDSIMAGTTTVPKSQKATEDASGNVIIDTYMTKLEGASKTYVKDYSLPKLFNKAFYLSSDQTTFTDTSTHTSFTKTTSSIGYTTVFDAIWTDSDVKFQLADKNGFIIKMNVSCNTNSRIRFAVSTFVRANSSASWTQANSQNSELIDFVAGDVKTVTFDFNFDDLSSIWQFDTGYQIRQVVEMFSTDSTTRTYTFYTGTGTRFYLSTASYTLITGVGSVGEIVPITITNSSIDTTNQRILFTMPAVDLQNNTFLQVIIPSTQGQSISGYETYQIYLTQDGYNLFPVQGLGASNSTGFASMTGNDFKVFKVGNTYNYRFSGVYSDSKIKAEVLNLSDVGISATKLANLMQGDIGVVVDLNQEQTKVDVHIDMTGSSNGSVLRATSDDVSWGSVDTTATSSSANLITSGGVYSGLATKQDTLVSGTNIKTINNQSIVGSGNLSVSGIPSGGTTGQSLVKHSNTDQDVEWSSIIAGATVDASNNIHLQSATSVNASTIDYKNASGTILGNLKFVKCTQAEYEAITTPDTDTYYIIVG